MLLRMLWKLFWTLSKKSGRCLEICRFAACDVSGTKTMPENPTRVRNATEVPLDSSSIVRKDFEQKTGE